MPVNARISWNVRQRLGNYLLIEPRSSRCSRCMCIRFMQCKSRYGQQISATEWKVALARAISRSPSNHIPSDILFYSAYIIFCYQKVPYPYGTRWYHIRWSLWYQMVIRWYLIVGYFRDVYCIRSHVILYMSIRRFPRCFLSFASWSYLITLSMSLQIRAVAHPWGYSQTWVENCRNARGCFSTGHR